MLFCYPNFKLKSFNLIFEYVVFKVFHYTLFILIKYTL